MIKNYNYIKVSVKCNDSLLINKEGTALHLNHFFMLIFLLSSQTRQSPDCQVSGWGSGEPEGDHRCSIHLVDSSQLLPSGAPDWIRVKRWWQGTHKSADLSMFCHSLHCCIFLLCDLSSDFRLDFLLLLCCRRGSASWRLAPETRWCSPHGASGLHGKM